jgi:hypothetical protein
MYTVRHTVLVVGAVTQVACPAVKLVGKELVVACLAPHKVVAERVLGVQVEARGGEEGTSSARMVVLIWFSSLYYVFIFIIKVLLEVL